MPKMDRRWRSWPAGLHCLLRRAGEACERASGFLGGNGFPRLVLNTSNGRVATCAAERNVPDSPAGTGERRSPSDLQASR